MDIIYAQDERLLDWCGERLRITFPPESRTIAAIDQAEILCVVAYSRFTPHNCEMSIASSSPRWCTRRFLKAGFHYPFVQCDLQRVSFVTTPDNEKTVSLLQRLGAVREGILRRWFGERDGLLYGMLKSECRWIK